MIRVLFVCVGNICRSPAAVGVLNSLIQKHGLEGEISAESAGTGVPSVGLPPDARMQKIGAARGHQIIGSARQFTENDFSEFDYIVTLDESNRKGILSLAPDENSQRKVRSVRDLAVFYSDREEVPDPYMGQEEDFEEALDIIEDICMGLLLRLRLIDNDE